MVEKLLQDGVYLGLDEAPYFAQPRLGSTDISRLFLRAEGWWWSSHLNPDHVDPPEDNRAKVFGKALHAMILEGDDAYAERFAEIPDKAVERAKWGDLFCDTIPEMMAALEKRAMHPKGAQKKEFYQEVCRSRAPELKLWDDIEGAARKANAGKLGVTAAEKTQLDIMALTVREHPDIGHLFRFDGTNVPLAELSVLWTDEHGIQRRGRLDLMLPQHIIDLKTLAAIGSRPLNFAAGDHVAKMGYFVQAADHHQARKWAYRLIEAGKVHGGSEAQRRWLGRFPTEAKSWEYCWLLYQKPDPKNGLAPIIFPWVEDYGSELHMDGIRARRKAIETYKRCMLQFGPDKPWTRVEPLHSTAEGHPHRVFVPHWVAQEQVPGEQEDL